MRYTVHLVNTVSASVVVDAENPQAAIEAAYESDDMPGGITVGAFGVADVDDDDWNAIAVQDESGETVWEESS